MRDLDAALIKNAEELGQRGLIYECIDRGEAAEWRNPIVQARIQKRGQRSSQMFADRDFELHGRRAWIGWNWNAECAGPDISASMDSGTPIREFEAIRISSANAPPTCAKILQIGMIFVACNMAHIQPFELMDSASRPSLT